MLNTLPIKNKSDNNKEFIKDIHNKFNNTADFDIDSDNLYIKVDKERHTFNFYDNNKNYIGNINPQYIVKYLSLYNDQKNQFLKNVDSNEFKKSRQLIKSNIFKFKYNKNDNYTDIILLDHTQSSFMCDVELLEQLNTFLEDYYNNNLFNDLANIDDDDSNTKKIIQNNVEKLIIILLNHTMKTIHNLSIKIKDMQNQEKTKLYFLNYSININYTLNKYIDSKIDQLSQKNEYVSNKLEKSIKLKTQIRDKITQNMDTIKKSIDDNNNTATFNNNNNNNSFINDNNDNFNINNIYNNEQQY